MKLSRYADVFVSGAESFDEAASVVGQSLGGEFFPGPDDDLLLVIGRVAVNLGPHIFDDGDLTADNGYDIPLRTEYLVWFEVRDLDKDYDRQNFTALRIVEAASSAGWRAVGTDEFQDLLAVRQ